MPIHTERGDFDTRRNSLPLGTGGNFSEILTCFQCTEQESGSLAAVRCHLAPSVRTTRLRRNRRQGRRFEICRRKLCLGNTYHTVARGFSVCVRYGKG